MTSFVAADGDGSWPSWVMPRRRESDSAERARNPAASAPRWKSALPSRTAHTTLHHVVAAAESVSSTHRSGSVWYPGPPQTTARQLGCLAQLKAKRHWTGSTRPSAGAGRPAFRNEADRDVGLWLLSNSNSGCTRKREACPAIVWYYSGS